MSTLGKKTCDQGHDWKWAHDFIGDSDAPNGSKRITFRVCRICGIEEHENPDEGSDESVSVPVQL